MSHTTKPARLPVAGRPQLARMPALIILAYAVAVTLLFLAVSGYAAGFFAGFTVPKGIDQGTRAAVPVAAGIDLLLLLLFAVQHTVMARLWFVAADNVAVARLLRNISASLILRESNTLEYEIMLAPSAAPGGVARPATATPAR